MKENIIEMMRSVNNILEDDEKRTGINQFKVSEIYLKKLKVDLISLFEWVDDVCKDKVKQSFLENKKEPVKLSDLDKHNLIGYIYEDFEASDEYRFKLIKKVCEL